MNCALRVLLALVLAAAGTVAQGSDAERRYELADQGFLKMTVPDGWLDEVHAPGPQEPPTIVYRPLEGDAFLVLVTPLWRPAPEMRMPTREGLRERTQRGLERVRPRAVEKQIHVSEFAGASGPGFYFSATDRSPKPGEFTFLTQGMLRVDELIVTFTILSNTEKDRGALLTNTLAMLQAAAQVEQ